MNTPYLSIVAVTRNDNYGGDLLSRIRMFISFLRRADYGEAQVELILVEWNPPKDHLTIGEALAEFNGPAGPLLVRVVTVPTDVHSEVSAAQKLPLLEYCGKNVGIRRARGEFVLVTNPDVIFNPALVRVIARREFKARTFYRIDRTDFRGPLPDCQSLAEICSYCSSHVIRTFRRYSTAFTSEAGWYSRVREAEVAIRRTLRFFPRQAPHVNAAGDFLLAPKAEWHRVGGFPELEPATGVSHHIDALMVHAFLFSGLNQHVLRAPAALYHLEHRRRGTKGGIEAEATDGQKLWPAATRRLLDETLAAKRWAPLSLTDWGLPDRALTETAL